MGTRKPPKIAALSARTQVLDDQVQRTGGIHQHAAFADP
jgi:hypothetical protein